MKKVVDGKMYNTETAEWIASYDNGLSRNDFGFCWEDLYRTKKGAFFVYGRGGALSRWSQSCGNGRCGGSGIEPLAEFEAREWCETHDVDADTITKYFTVEEA